MTKTTLVLFAVLIVVVFCWLGFAAYKIAPVWEGLGVRLPFMNRLMLLYGPFAAPIIGVIGAISIIVLGVRCPRHWGNPILLVILGIVWVCGFHSLLISGVFWYLRTSLRPMRIKLLGVGSKDAPQTLKQGVRAAQVTLP